MKLEVLATTGDGVGAAVIKGLLELHGIPAMLRAYQSAGWLFPGTPGCLGAMEVLVPAARLDEARRVLEEAQAEGRLEGAQDGSGDASALP